MDGEQRVGPEVQPAGPLTDLLVPPVPLTANRGPRRAGHRSVALLVLVIGVLAGCTATSGTSIGDVNKVVSEVRPSTFLVANLACGVLHEGSSFVVAPETVVTNAHVVAGATKVDLQDNSVLRPASVVLYDPILDVAVLRVPSLTAPPLTVYTGKVPKDALGVIVAYPSGTSEVTSDAHVMTAFQAVGLDVYGQKQVTRSVYQLQVNRSVDPGEGGGPVVSTGSSPGLPARTVFALIFARSTVVSYTGFALAMGPVMADVATAKDSQTPVSTGACVSPDSTGPIPVRVPATIIPIGPASTQ